MGTPGGTFAQNYKEDNAIIRTRAQWLLTAVALILGLTFPLFSGPHLLHLANYVGLLIIASLGLNILIGYTGQLSIGHAAFVAIGAYTSAVLTTHFGMSFWIALPCAALLAGIVGIIFGLPSVRIQGFYLLMSTLAAQFIILYVISHWDSITGGMAGLGNLARPTIGNFTISSELSFYYLIAIVTVLAAVAAKNLTRTKAGRAFVAIRDNDLAAKMMGVNLTYYKLLAFFISCVYAGVAGAIYAHWVGGLIPDQFTLSSSIWYIGYIIIGGLGTAMGPVFGTIFIVAITEGLSLLVTMAGAANPQSMAYIAPMKAVIFGLLIIVFLMFEPRGLNHRWGLIKAYYRMWPFAY